MPNVRTGQSLFVNIQLWDHDETKFPRCWLYDATGSEIAESPVDLSHLDNGLYTKKTGSVKVSAFVMPDTDEVTAVFIVYNEVGRTTVSSDHSDDMETYNRDGYLDSIESKIELITLNNIQAVLDQDNEVVGYIESTTTITGEVDQDDEVSGELSSDENIVGEIDQNQYIVGELIDVD